MTVLETVRIATRALRRNKLRSFLTALGIVIGVGAVIAMVAIGEGARAKVEEQFAAMGSNLLIVMPGSSSSGGMRGGFGTQPTLRQDCRGSLAAASASRKPCVSSSRRRRCSPPSKAPASTRT